MSLFQCEACGCVENTALCNYWTRKAEGLPLLCSECGEGEWHGEFPKRHLPIGEFVTNDKGNLSHREHGEVDLEEWKIDPPDRQYVESQKRRIGLTGLMAVMCATGIPPALVEGMAVPPNRPGNYDTDELRDDEARMTAAERKRQRRMARNRRMNEERKR